MARLVMEFEGIAQSERVGELVVAESAPLAGNKEDEVTDACQSLARGGARRQASEKP